MDSVPSYPVTRILFFTGEINVCTILEDELCCAIVHMTLK